MSEEIESIAAHVIETAMGVHIDVGPGLLESVYETLLAARLEKQRFHSTSKCRSKRESMISIF
jgi:GxxExxY protein